MAKDELHGEGEFECECGRKFTHGAWYAKHKLHCTGKAVPTRGRIERLAARAGRALVPVKPKREPTRRSTPVPAPTPAAATGAIAAAATDKAMELTIAGLIGQRDRINVAIEALQALRV